MQRIADALELLTAQHDEIDRLLAVVSTSGSDDLRARARDELGELLAIHIALEQELFYPAVSAVITTGVRQELDAEATEIKRILGDLLWLEPDDPDFRGAVTALTAMFAVHRTWQEMELFVTVAESYETVDLIVLGEKLHAWIARMMAALAHAA